MLKLYRRFSDSNSVKFLPCFSNYFGRETENAKKKERNKKHKYLIHTLSNKAFKNTVVNQALSCLPGGLLEITLTKSLSIITSRMFEIQLLFSIKGLLLKL